MTLKLILILFFSPLVCCYGQSNQLINVPVLKQDVVVNAVLDKFIARRPKSLIELSRLGGEYSDNVKTLLKDSCLLIPVSQEDSVKDNNIYVESKTKMDINQEINICEHLKFKYGYFRYQGFKVFVWTRNNFGPLFSKTERSQTWNFIYYAAKDQTYPRDWVSDGMDYQITKKSLSERAPTVITKKGNR